MIAWWLWLAACKRPTPPPDLVATERAVPAGPVREDVEGPAPWSGAGAVCLQIPAAWAGSTGAAPHLLDVVHAPTDVRVSLFAWPWGTPVPRVPDGFVLAFHDEDSYRTVPLLHPGASYTLLGSGGEVVQGWYGPVDGRVLVVEVAAPFGRTTEGRDVADNLLRALTRCDAGASPPSSSGTAPGTRPAR